jgi:hypothetical protein
VNVIRRAIPSDASTFAPNRPVNGVVLHHTAGSTTPYPQRGASWHYVVGPDGTVFVDVPEDRAAHHCGATDRWRPPWVVRSQVAVSDANYCTLGVEITYAPQWGQVPNAAQHQAVRELLADMYVRRGRLPVVGHGELQLDKWVTEPHALNWTAAGCGERTVNGRYLIVAAPEEPAMTPAERSILDAATRRSIDDGAELDFLMGTRDTLAEQKSSLETLLATSQEETRQWMAEAERWKQQAQDAQTPITTRITRVHVTATLEDSSTQELEGVPV